MEVATMLKVAQENRCEKLSTQEVNSVNLDFLQELEKVIGGNAFISR